MTDAAADVPAVIERYGRFARAEAPGRSELYAQWAQVAASDPRVAQVIARVPAARRQPPLVFAVSRLLGAPESTASEWRAWVLEHADELVAECARRSLQTNEPQRCAALLPALSLVDGPIALIELGASAGLCLYPDRYSYRYAEGPALDPATGASAVVLESMLTGEPPLRMPHIVWRAGIDLAPLDAADPADRRFLTTLVWPGEAGRAARMDAALDLVAADPPLLTTGDATDPALLERVLAQAPAGASVVVTTPGVLPHVPWAARERLFAWLRQADVTWITIDPPALHGWSAPIDPAEWEGFVLGVDGIPVAAVDPLGAWVRWCGR